MSACVGCGYCCWRAPCVLSLQLHGYIPGRPCPGLVFDGQQHLCVLAQTEAQQRGLAFGEGCCCALNSWRREPIKNRREFTNAY